MTTATEKLFGRKLAAIAAILISVITLSAGAADTTFTPEQVAFFEKDVKPLLEASCFKCHGGEPKIKGGLRVTSREGLLKGGQQGPSIDLKNLEKSLFLEMLTFKDEEHSMPPKGKLPQAQIDVLTKWVKMGAPWTPGDKPAAVAHHEEAKTVKAEDWWAYKPLTRPAAPEVKDKKWVKNPIDSFILGKLEAKGLGPVAPADKTSLIRRAYFDLIGLPPTPAEVDAFVKDSAPDAYEKLLDRLLAMPQYGEKWGRHWLDLVRYAETNGYERDGAKPHVWRYRDYVIKSFNEDKPYDQFIKEQIAGDELDNVTTDSIVATGYYRLGVWDDEPADKKLAKYDVLDGVVSTTAQVVLATTLNCARCHDHKKDPLTQKDYYSMLAFFHDVTDYGNDKMLRNIASGESKAEQEKKIREKEEKESRLFGQIFALEESFKQLASANHKDIAVDVLPTSDMTDLSYKFYRDTFQHINGFENLRPETEGTLSANYFSTSPASRDEAIAMTFDGKLNVPEDGKYTFTLDTKDGSILKIDGAVVCEHNEKGRRKVEETVMLKKGQRSIRLEYFNVQGPPLMLVFWSGPNFKKRPLSMPSLGSSAEDIIPDARKAAQAWSYTTAAPANDWMQPGFDDKAWKTGTSGFGTNPPNSESRTQWNTNDIWLRKNFELTSIPGRLTMSVYHDEDVEVYLNGKAVYKAAGFLVDYKTVGLPKEAIGALKTGTNVIAVHCKQTGGGQYIDVGLTRAPEKADIVQLIKSHGVKVLGKEKFDQYNNLRSQLEQSRRAKADKNSDMALAVAEAGRSKTKVLLRGNPNLEGDEVQPGFPAVLDPRPVTVPKVPNEAPTTMKRRVLADWLTSKENRMTARALANRLWQYHFGRGIVRTPNDFGQLGEMPTHPELLDWLATEITARDWKLKAMHKLIMTSSTYMMSSKDDLAGLTKDPNNDLFWRFDMRRMTAEEIRDSILAVNGTLNLKMGGPSIYTEVPREVLLTSSQPDKAWGKSTPEDAARRSIYIFIKRSLVEPILNTFDVADTDSSCAARFATTVPTQALTSLNSKFYNDQAMLFAQRLKREAGSGVRDQVKLGLRLALSREAKDSEVQRGVSMIERLQSEDKVSADKALDYFCLVVLNMNEFVYLD